MSFWKGLVFLRGVCYVGCRAGRVDTPRNSTASGVASCKLPWRVWTTSTFGTMDTYSNCQIFISLIGDSCDWWEITYLLPHFLGVRMVVTMLAIV